MDPQRSKADYLNQVTRSLMAIMGMASACAAFLWGVVKKDVTIDAAAFIGLIVIAVGWWYGQNQERKRASDAPNGGPNGNGTTPPPAA